MHERTNVFKKRQKNIGNKFSSKYIGIYYRDRSRHEVVN